MTIPKRLKIGGHTYQVKLEKPGELGQDKVGCHDIEKGLISIDSTLAKSHQEATLLHEILHAVNSELEHPIVEALAQQLYQVLSDNKMLR